MTLPIWPTHHQVGSGDHAHIVSEALGGYVQIDGKMVDLTPHVFYFETAKERDAFAEAVEVEQARRGIHPLQTECRSLDHPETHRALAEVGQDLDAARKQHQAAHKALNKKAGL